MMIFVDVQVEAMEDEFFPSFLDRYAYDSYEV